MWEAERQDFPGGAKGRLVPSRFLIWKTSAMHGFCQEPAGQTRHPFGWMLERALSALDLAKFRVTGFESKYRIYSTIK